MQSNIKYDFADIDTASFFANEDEKKQVSLLCEYMYTILQMLQILQMYTILTKKAADSTELERTEEERRLEIKIERYLPMMRSSTIVA